LTLFSIAMLTASAFAADYYVASGGNDGNGCTQARDARTPKATIASAASCLQAGDTLYLRGPGPYAGYSFDGLHGRADAWITVKSYPGERATIDFSRLGGGIGFNNS